MCNIESECEHTLSWSSNNRSRCKLSCQSDSASLRVLQGGSIRCRFDGDSANKLISAKAQHHIKSHKHIASLMAAVTVTARD